MILISALIGSALTTTADTPTTTVEVAPSTCERRRIERGTEYDDGTHLTRIDCPPRDGWSITILIAEHGASVIYSHENGGRSEQLTPQNFWSDYSAGFSGPITWVYRDRTPVATVHAYTSQDLTSYIVTSLNPRHDGAACIMAEIYTPREPEVWEPAAELAVRLAQDPGGWNCGWRTPYVLDRRMAEALLAIENTSEN